MSQRSSTFRGRFPLMVLQIHANPWRVISRSLFSGICMGVYIKDSEKMLIQIGPEIQETLKHVKSRLSHDMDS